MNENEIILFAREEAEQLAGRILTNDEWLTIREWITSDNNMWKVIDQCIKITIDDVIG